jgi:flagellar biosynthesis/type III secretory pathway protein FliH
MPHETSIRLPGRLVGVVRTDTAAPVPVAPPLASAATPNTALATAPVAVATADAADRERVRRVLAGFTEAAAGLRAQGEQLAQMVEPLAVDLAIAVARRFLHEQTASGAFPLAALVRQAIERLDTRQPVSVLLHPEDLALLQRQLGANADLLGNADVRVAADTTLTRGSCKVQSQERGVRFDLESRLAALRQQLLDAATK